MRFFNTLLQLLLCSLVASNGLSFLKIGGQSVSTEALESVPGKNPMTYCQKDHSSDILVIEHVNLNPNPPTAGTKLTIEATGTLLKDIEKGAYVNLQVKYGLIRLVNIQQDLCDQVSNIDMECPVKKGLVKIVKEVELPKEIPPGTYTVVADAYTEDEEDKIICLEATVKFEKEL